MNLHVDLLLESERRSASAFNLKAVLRVLSIVGPAALLLGFVLIGINFYQMKLEVQQLDNAWKVLEPKKERAEQFRNQVSSNQKILDELKGMAAANMRWDEQLAGLMPITPVNVQFRKLTVNQSVRKEDKQTVRVYRMSIDGKAVGPTSEQAVSTLKDRLLTSSPFATAMKTATVTAFGADRTSSANRDDRAFRIDCEYRPLEFDEAAAR